MMTETAIKQPDATDMTDAEIELLKKLEEENRRIQDDLKSPSNTVQNAFINTRPNDVRDKAIRQNSIPNESMTSLSDSDSSTDSERILWTKIMNDWSTYHRKNPQVIKDAIRSGVPAQFRSALWQNLAKADASAARKKYGDYMKMTSSCEKVIRRDISRTYPEHELFKEPDGIGQQGLFNVIKAYSLFDREVGYCQGIGFIVGLLLMNMPEEEAFAVLVSIMQDFSMRDMYKPDMFFLGLSMYQLECMAQEILPTLYRHFQLEDFNTSMYASSWFLTLFTTQFSINVASRIMDLFLSEGMEILFRLGIALLETHQEELMLLSMEDMLKYFQKEIPAKHETDHESLFQRAFTVQYNAKKMKKLEKEYVVIRKEEQEEQVEIRRLRNENRILKQRVENLEKESATLANRLIEGQVQNAQYAEDSYHLKHENSSLKKQLEEINNHNSNDRTKENIDQDSSSSILLPNDSEELESLREAVHKLTLENHELKSSPNVEIVTLQEELTMLKMRDAEAQVNMNELRQRIADLNDVWQTHSSTCHTTHETANASDSNLNENAYELIAHELISLKMREANFDCDNKLLSQKLMDSQTQQQVLHNQLKRKDEEMQKTRAELEASLIRENEIRTQLNDTRNKIKDRRLRQREDSMMVRIREVESTQAIADLRHRIAQLEIQNQELISRSQITEDKDLQEKFIELQDEVMNLRLLQAIYRKQSISTDLTSIDYEESEDGSLTSSIRLSSSINHRLSSSFTVLFPNSFISSNHHLRQSTPSLFPTFSSSRASTSAAS